jgi:hypothetical protein
MYKLINEIASAGVTQAYLVEAVNEIFGEDATELYESAERYMGQAIASLNSGKNPFEGDQPQLDPHIIGSLILLSDPANREAFNFTPAKFAILDHIDKSDKVRKFLKNKVGMSQSGRNAAENLQSMASENPKAAARMLQKAQLAFAAAEQQHQQAA